ncbi:Manganese transport system ATP-binding protein MntB [uncultured Gammaproteobacteria bacterium]
MPTEQPKGVGQLRVHGLTLGYQRHPAVHHVNGVFASGSLTAVVGPNGAGKSTLLKGLMGLIRPLAGRVESFGLAPADIAYLPQLAEIDRTFPVSVLETALLGHWRRTGSFGAYTSAMVSSARAALATVGLAGFERRPIGSLSVGQFQRALFARALVHDARLILLDEPFTALDERTTHDLLGLIKTWHDQGRTVVAVLHDLEQVRGHFPDTLLLARELVAWGPTVDTLTTANLSRAKAMAEAWDEHAAECHRGAAA